MQTSTYMYINQSHHMSTTGTIYLCDIVSHLHFVFILGISLGYITEKIKVGDLYLGDLMMNQNKY